MTRHAPIRWLAALALLLATQLGVTCASLMPPPAPNTQLRIEVKNVYPIGAGYLLDSSLCVDTDHDFQAFDVTVDWQGNGLAMIPLLDSDFDDDGVPFGAPLPSSTSTAPFRLVDLRHGSPAPAGTTCVGRIWIYAPDGGAATLSATGSLGRPDGTVVQAAAGSVTHTP